MLPGDDAPRRDRSNWPLVACFLLLGAAAGGTAAYVNWPSAPAAPARIVSNAPVASPPAAAPSKPAAPPALPAEPTRPSFDVVRIGPQGQAVIAGRAEPGAEVTVHDGMRILGKTTADAQGQFILLPDTALKPGGRELTLSARTVDGREIAGLDSTILIVLPPQTVSTEPTSPAVAVLLPHGNGAPLVFEGGGKNRKLALDTVDYDDNGEIRFSGSAKADAPVRIYVDDKPVGDAVAGNGGQWTIVPNGPVAPGVHRLRVDQLGPNGRVLSRVELPFQRTASPPEGLADGKAVVQPGQNLWRIARQSYGQGTRYMVIYLANRDQIRDPNRIYPGQVFAMPPRS